MKRPPLSEKERERLRKAMHEVVDRQIADNDPPETAQTYQRLCNNGHSPEEARNLIAGVVVEATVNVMHGHEWDAERYAELLGRLPRLPWE